MQRGSRHRGVLGVLASGLLLSVAHGVPEIGWIAFVSLVPWLLGGWGRGWRWGAISGLGVGASFGAISGAWVVETLVQLGSEPYQAWSALVVVSVLITGIPYAVVGSVLCRGATTSVTVRMCSAAGVLFIVDGLRSADIVGVPWLLLGYSQWQQTNLAQLASLGGVPLISAIIGAGNVVAAVVVRRVVGSEQIGLGASGRALVGGVTAVALWSTSLVEAVEAETKREERVELLVVQPNLPVEDRWTSVVQRTNLEIVARLTEQSVNELDRVPDVIVWPETVITTPVDSDEGMAAALRELGTRLGVPLVLGAVRSAPSGKVDRYRNSALWLDERGEVASAVDKEAAVPVAESGGDFLGSTVVRALVGQPSEQLLMEEVVSEGPLGGRHSFAVIFCYEVIFPHLASNRRGQNAIAILNLANDSWYQSPVLSMQQIGMGVFRAIEQRLPLVRVAHGGVSAEIDRYGRIVQRIPFDKAGAASVGVDVKPTNGLMDRAILAGLLLGGAIAGAIGHRVVGR